MIEHISLPVHDYKKAKKFYVAALKPLKYKLHMEFPGAAGFVEGGHTSFWIVKHGRGAKLHIAFLAKSKKMVQAFHTAALKAGAKDNGKPDFRLDYGPDYYAAYVLDPEGNNIEAAYFGARAPKPR